MTIGLTAEMEELSQGSLHENQTPVSHLKCNRHGINYGGTHTFNQVITS